MECNFESLYRICDVQMSNCLYKWLHIKINLSYIPSRECKNISKIIYQLRILLNTSPQNPYVWLWSSKCRISSSSDSFKKGKDAFYDWKNGTTFEQICTRNHNPLSSPAIAPTALWARKLFEQP